MRLFRRNAIGFYAVYAAAMVSALRGHAMRAYG